MLVQVALSGKEPACQCRGDPGVRSLGQEDPLEEGMATHSSILAWEIPWTQEPGRLQSVGSQRLGTGLKRLSVNSCSPILSLSLSELPLSVDHGESPAEVRDEHLGVAHFSLVTQSCPTLCDPRDCSSPGFPVVHRLLEVVQTHVHRVGDAIQPSHPRLSLSPPAFNLSLCQGLFQ